MTVIECQCGAKYMFENTEHDCICPICPSCGNRVPSTITEQLNSLHRLTKESGYKVLLDAGNMFESRLISRNWLVH